MLAVFTSDSHSHLEATISSLHHKKKGLFSLSVSVVSSEGSDKSKEVNLILKIRAQQRSELVRLSCFCCLLWAFKKNHYWRTFIHRMVGLVSVKDVTCIWHNSRFQWWGPRIRQQPSLGCGSWFLLVLPPFPVFLCTLNIFQYFVIFSLKQIPSKTYLFLILNFILSILNDCAKLVFIISNSCGASYHVLHFTKPPSTFLCHCLPHTYIYKVCDFHQIHFPHP